MTKELTHLDLVQRDAQELHDRINANIALAEKATWSHVQTMQTEATNLATRMKDIAAGQADTLQAGVNSAIAKLEAGAKLVQDKAAAGKDDIQRANAALLTASQHAAESLSHAVTAFRSMAAKAIEPK